MKKFPELTITRLVGNVNSVNPLNSATVAVNVTESPTVTGEGFRVE